MKPSYSSSVIDALEAHIAILDEQGRILSVNRAWREFAEHNGVAPASVSEGVNYLHRCNGITGPDAGDVQTFLTGLRAVMNGHKDHFAHEYPCHAAKVLRWFVARVTRFEEKGKFRTVVAHENITDRKLAEQQLLHTTERYRELFEYSGTGIIIVDEHGTYLMANVKAASLLGHTPEQLVGMTMFDVLPHDTVHRYLERNRRLLETGGHREYEDTFDLPGGKMSFLIVDQCIKDEAGRNVAIQSSSVNITDRHNMEAVLKKQERALLEIQDTERKRIAYELHDEIGQVLTAIKLNLHAIQQFGQDVDIPAKMNDCLSLVESSLQQVRDLSGDLHPWMLDQVGLIPSLRWHIDRRAQRSRINMIFRPGTITERFSPEVEIACFRVIQEALTNIIRHAMATDVVVTLARSGSWLVVNITDNGIGFDRDAVRAEPGSARGFGLLSMEERVRLLDGTFYISSQTNHGTTVHFTVPISEPHTASSTTEG